MNDIRAVNCIANNFLIGFGKCNADLMDIIVLYFPEIVIRYDKDVFLILSGLIRAQNAYRMTFLLQKFNQVHCRNRSSVIFFAKYVAHNGNYHHSLLFGKVGS